MRVEIVGSQKDDGVRTLGRVIGTLVHSNGNLLVTFEDLSELEIKRKDYDFFWVANK